MGLVVSQLGNVVQSAVGESDRSEAGGLQYTAQQLGSSLGTALIGAIVISGLAAAFTANVSRRPAHLAGGQAAGRACGSRATCRSSPPSSVEQGAQEAGIARRETEAIVEDYADAQLKALKTGLLAAALAAVAAFAGTGNLPARAGPAGEPEGPPPVHALA